MLPNVSKSHSCLSSVVIQCFTHQLLKYLLFTIYHNSDYSKHCCACSYLLREDFFLKEKFLGVLLVRQNGLMFLFWLFELLLKDYATLPCHHFL